MWAAAVMAAPAEAFNALSSLFNAASNIFGGSSRPASAPAPPSPREMARLNQELEQIQQERAQVAQMHEQRMQQIEAAAAERQRALDQREAELQKRDAELQRREQEAQTKLEEQRRKEEEYRNYPLQPYQVNSGWQGMVNIGLVGNSGVGKSLLCNAIRGVTKGQPHWSPVGVGETTTEPLMYPWPQEHRARLWDLPGGGTQRFPRDEYIRTVGLRHFDAVLVIAAGRFTEMEFSLLAELRQYQVPCFAVRTKIDICIQNNMCDNGHSAEQTKQQIADEFRPKGTTALYFVNSRSGSEHDFPRLLQDVRIAIQSNRKTG